LSSAASTADGTWCTIHGSGADPDDCGQILYSIYLLILCRLFYLLSSFFGCITTVHTYYLWLCSRSTVVRSYIDRAVKVAWLWRAALGDRTATTVRAVRAQTDSRPTALRLKSRSKEFWTFQNSALRLKRLVRPYGDLCDRPRPQWDRSATAVRPYCDLTRFGRKIGRGTVAVRSQPWCDWGITASS